jgi:carboxylate-amine ligase
VPEPDDLSEGVLLANDFRACRQGLDATFLDGDGSLRPMREVAARTLEDARKVLAPDGLDGPLEAVQAMLVGPPEHRRQRHLCGQEGMPALLAELAARTADVHG